MLEGYTYATSEPLAPPAFSFAFVVVAVTTAFAAVPFLGLPADAGNSVSGHRVIRDTSEAATTRSEAGVP